MGNILLGVKNKSLKGNIINNEKLTIEWRLCQVNEGRGEIQESGRIKPSSIG